MLHPFRIMVLTAVSMLLVASLSPAAVAAAASVSDERGDAVAHLDIVGVTYSNNTRNIRARVRVRDLSERGIFTLRVAPPATDVSLVAEVTAHRLRWGVQDNTSTKWLGCAGSAHRWSVAQNFVHVQIPRACLNRNGFRGTLYMQVISGYGDGDYADSRILRRG